MSSPFGTMAAGDSNVSKGLTLGHQDQTGSSTFKMSRPHHSEDKKAALSSPVNKIGSGANSEQISF